MKTFLYISIISFFPLFSSAQNPNSEIVDFPEESAQFHGGDGALNTFISQNIIYPLIALEMELQGKCIIGFIIDENGTISDVKVLKGVVDCPECDREALRVVKLMPNWIPAKDKGKSVKSRYMIPINFKLISSGRKNRRSKK